MRRVDGRARDDVEIAHHARRELEANHPDFPIARILLLLTVSVGLPYFVLSSTGPLLQAWFARAHELSPYRLYSLSNAGSLLALITYPFVVEPELPLRTQGLVWAALYMVFAIGIMACASGLWKAPHSIEPESLDTIEIERPSTATYALWIMLAACASLMLIASTNQMSQDIAPIPFLWILPLALYLISFIICFDNQRWYRRRIFHPAFILTVFVSLIVLVQTEQALPYLSHLGLAPNRVTLAVQIVTAAALLFTLCMVCHGELVRMRPHTRHLTAFYLMVAIGGAIGGVLGAIVAPLLFRGYWELRLAISMAMVLMFVVLIRDRHSWVHQSRPALVIALLIGALVLPQVIGLGAFGWLYDLPQMIVIALGVALVALRQKRRCCGDGPESSPNTHLLSAIVIVSRFVHHHHDRGVSECRRS